MCKKIVICLFVIGSFIMGGNSAIAADKEVTLRIMVEIASLSDKLIDVWHKENPNIKIVREDVDLSKFIADYLANDPPDVFQVGAGADIPYFVARGMLLDITSYLKNNEYFKESDIDIGGNAAYKVNGRWYGLPKDYNNVTAITYNKEIFAKAGLPFPSATEPMTYAEFYDIAEKLTSETVFGTEIHGFWSIFLADDKAKMIGKRIMDGDVMNEDPEIRAIWKEQLQLRTKGISSNLKKPLSGWAGSAFQAGNIAMVQLGYWYGASCYGVEGYNEKFGWAPAPIMKKGGKRITSSLGATGFVIASKTKHPDETAKFFNWYMGGAPGIERASTGWGLPPVKSMNNLLPRGNEFDRQRTNLALESVKYMEAPALSSYVSVDMYNSAWNKAKQALLTGATDLDGAVDMFYKSVNASIELGMEEVGE